MTRARQIPAETLVSLRQRLDALPVRCRERRELVESTARLFGVSDDTLYRALRRRVHVSSNHRADRGKPRKLSVAEMDRREGTCDKPTQNHLSGNICIADSYSSATSESARSR